VKKVGGRGVWQVWTTTDMLAAGRKELSAEVKKVGGRGVWQVWTTTDMLAAGRKELRDALAEIVRKAAENGWVDAGKAERWLEKLEKGRALREGWPKYYVGLSGSGALDVRFGSTDPEGIEREVQRLRAMGLVEGAEGREGGLRLDPQGGLGVRRPALHTRLRRTAEARGGVRGVHTPEGQGGGRRGL